ncbi:MAG: Sulfotransferase domain protein [Bacteroidetes bacterium]|nr:Sulfotransferase domain protein [Bacteroidota bacterium]
MIIRYKRKYLFIIAVIWLTLPITLIKQRFFPLNRKKKRKDFPDFLVIGAQKSGTTWLYANMKVQPELFLSEKKEIHYYDWYFHRSMRWYLKHFKNAGNKLKGEITPAYATMEWKRVKYIKRHNPNLKVIFIVRDPVERAWSHALNNYCTGMNIPFEKLTHEDFEWHFNSYPSLIRSDYGYTVKNWTSVFPKEQFHLCFYEDLKSTPEQLLGSVFDFLGVKTPESFADYPFNKVINRGPSHKIPEVEKKKLEALYYPKIKEMEPWLGKRVLSWIRS